MKLKIENLNKLNKQEAQKLRELHQKKEEIYMDSSGKFEIRQNTIISHYNEVEKNFNNFCERRIDGRTLANNLGRIEWGIGKTSDDAIHPSAQIYAFECLMKSLAEAQNKEDIDTIVKEIIVDAAWDKINYNDIKREYILGILAYYGGKYKIEDLEKDFNKEQESGLRTLDKEDRLKIFTNLFQGMEVNNKDNSKNNQALKNFMSIPQVAEIVELIKNDFPESNDDGAIAKLVAKYYEMDMSKRQETREDIQAVNDEIRVRTAGGEKKQDVVEAIQARKELKRFPTTYPNVPDELVADSESTPIKRPSSGIPERTVAVALGKHTSREKILEAEEYGWKLEAELLKIRGLTQRRIIFGGKEADAYIKEMRQLIDVGNTSEALGRVERFKQEVWAKLDDVAKNELGGRIENVFVRARTLKDFPVENLPENVANF